MRVIDPSYKILTKIDGVSFLKAIEEAGRDCYQSSHKITKDSYLDFVKKMIDNTHESTIEHSFFTARFICDRGVSHELVRHRLASFSQECVGGDTVVHKNGLTIKDLYDRSFTPHGKTHNKTISLKSCDSERNIVRNKIKNVFYKGKGELFEVETSLGYKIKATANHDFMIGGGSFSRLGDLSVGDSVMVNGRPSLIKMSDDDLSGLYLKGGLSPQEIADQYSVPYRSVLRRLHSIGIFKSHLNDKDMGKYNKNHTAESYAKMGEILKKQYDDGREPWNKGVKECQSDSVSRQADALREHHHNNGCGEDNSCWKGGRSPSYYLKQKLAGRCELCLCRDGKEIHHIDKDRANGNVNNLMRICLNCHKKLHFGWHIGTVAHLDTIVSITNVGVDDVYDLEMTAPNHNYVASGFVVHNSTRYCNYSKGRFGGEITVIRPYFFAKLGTDSPRWKNWYTGMLACEKAYIELLRHGASAQEARSVLPNSLKTSIVVTANAREWRHIFKLRCAKSAHPQMRELTVPLLKEVQGLIPVLYDDIEYKEVKYGLFR